MLLPHGLGITDFSSFYLELVIAYYSSGFFFSVYSDDAEVGSSILSLLSSFLYLTGCLTFYYGSKSLIFSGEVFKDGSSIFLTYWADPSEPVLSLEGV